MNQPVLFVIDNNELNLLAGLVEKLPLKDGLRIWQMLTSIAQNNGADKKLKSYELIDTDDPKAVKPKK